MMVPDLRNSASNNSNTIDHDKESFDEYGDEFNAHNLKLNQSLGADSKKQYRTHQLKQNPLEDLEDEIQNVFNYDMRKERDSDSNDIPDKNDLPDEAQEAIDQSAGMQQFLKKYSRRKMETLIPIKPADERKDQMQFGIKPDFTLEAPGMNMETDLKVVRGGEFENTQKGLLTDT